MEDVEVDYVIIKGAELGGRYVVTIISVVPWKGNTQIQRRRGDRRVLE